jgi:hypothetical protein
MLAGLAVVAAAVMVVVWPPTLQETTITRQRYELITPRMSTKELETILGQPGDYRTAPTKYMPTGGGEGWAESLQDAPRASTLRWQGDWGEIVVDLDSAGRTVSASYCDCRKAETTALENFRWRVERQWRRWFPY